MRINKFSLPIFIVSLWLTGCTTLSSQQPAVNQSLGWNQRSETLASLTDWDLKASVAIHAGKDAESGSLQWHQNGAQYSLLMFGPLGANSFVLNGSPKQVELTTPQGKKLYASSAEVLLSKETGWNLPVSDLAFWIRGLPAPDADATKHFDQFHHLTELDQKGWKIQYLGYSNVNQVDLPTKIFMTYPHLSLKIIITSWQIPHLS